MQAVLSITSIKGCDGKQTCVVLVQVIVKINSRF